MLPGELGHHGIPHGFQRSNPRPTGLTLLEGARGIMRDNQAVPFEAGLAQPFNCASEACDRCIAALTACVVVALP